MIDCYVGIRIRPRDIQATRRDRGHPRNYFKPGDISDMVHSVSEPVNANVALKTNEPFELPTNSVPHTQPLIPLANKYSVPYTLGTFFRKNLPHYVAYAKGAGVTKYDAADVVQDAISDFFEAEKIPSDTTLNLLTIQKDIKPKLKMYLDICIAAYHLEKNSEKASDRLDTLKIKEDEIDNPHLFSETSNPFLFFVTHRLFDKSEFSTPQEPVSSFAYAMDPITIKILREDAQSRIFDWLSAEILDAISEIKPELPFLRRKYAFRGSPEAFQALTIQTPLQDEVNIADYVAFGANNLTRDELLNEPLFYEALHSVLREVDFGVKLETPPTTSDVTFLPFGRKMARQGRNYINTGR